MSDEKALIKKEQKETWSFFDIFRSKSLDDYPEKNSRLLRILKLRGTTISKGEHGKIVLNCADGSVCAPGIFCGKVKVTSANDNKVWLKGKDKYGRCFQVLYELGKTKTFYMMEEKEYVW
ncbi:hypothetical protein LAU_0339 [Lausannevirus]|uniref:Uncharacterized protein n=2 Tax=Lausannevirus TaxID=999883 RepID=A0A0N9PMD1_9VIRU|nr:hypothetical protein LAU_0339 [Lausannevirus]AEA07190.1 hypothetical protein LAU_0339 [Lausannevirus]ALH07003.1 hypothetical protein PMV_305 [Port-miou virus]